MGVVENMKDVADLVKKFNDIELNRRILKLEEEVMDLSRDKRRLEDRVGELTLILEVKESLIYEDNYYFVQRGDIKDGPYCSACWDRNKYLVRIHSGTFSYGCPVCSSTSKVK
jgi:hypothetical protein